MTTTKDLIREHNALAADRGLPPLTGWKASKEALQARIDGLTAAETSEGETGAWRQTDDGPVWEPLVTDDPLAIPEEAQEPLGEPEPDTVPPEAAEVSTDDHGEPVEVQEPPAEETKAPRGVGKLIASLLVDPEGFDYAAIVEMVVGEFPQAQTSRRSIASVAAGLRRKGVEVPMRRNAKG